MSAVPTDWDWNSDYWRELAAPWGGLTTTVADMNTLLQVMLAGGTIPGSGGQQGGQQRILSAESTTAMLECQTHTGSSLVPGDSGARPDQPAGLALPASVHHLTGSIVILHQHPAGAFAAFSKSHWFGSTA